MAARQETSHPDGDATQKPLPLLDGGASLPHSVFNLSVPSEDPQREKLRTVVERVEEVDKDDPCALAEFAQTYLRLLRNKGNRHHFTGVPKRPEDLAEALKRPYNHGLAVRNMLDEVVAFAIIEDAQQDQGDSWLNKMVVANNLQGKKKADASDAERPPRIGTQSLIKILDWSFTTPAFDGRQRSSVHAAVIIKVPNYQRMDDLLTSNGFRFISRLEKQATVILGGKSIQKPVERFAIDRETWDNNRFVNTIRESLPRN